MDTSFRSSKMSRLPAPSTQIGGGLTEWSESQHNARIQSTMTSLASLKNLKREIPQPGTLRIEPLHGRSY
ncbi:kinesin-like nuclear fusion protein [Fusarium falciforme]|nr:kinesin-like nuclear fusion protein [Fusarium falciforme]